MLFWRNRHEVRDEELNAFVDGELEESVRRRVERHIESCAACSEAVAELQAISSAMSELPAVPAPRSFALREADVNRAPASGGAGLFGSATPLLSGVAAIAIVAFVVLAGVDIGSNASQGDNSSAASIADDMESQQLSGVERSGVADGDVAPEAGDEYAPPQDADAPGDGDDLSEGDLESTTDDDADGPIAPDLAAPSEEIAEEPRSRELAQGLNGNGNAPTLADDDGDGTGLRVAESVAAAVAIAAGGSVLLIWWRRRETAG